MVKRKVMLLAILLAVAAGCAPPPAHLSPNASQAFQKARLIKNLDVLRDAAVEANAQTLLSTASTRQVVLFHRTALDVIHASASGWEATVQVGLSDLLKAAPQAERNLIAPYVTLASAVLAEVVR